MRKEDNLPWLVKSAGRIMGPYSLEQIEELLRTREIVVLDEVAQPQRRFRYIRDIHVFGEILDELRKEATGDSGEKTFTESTEGQTASLTEPMNSHVMDELTDEVGFSNRTMGEIVYEDIQEETTRPKVSASVASRYQAGNVDNSTIHRKAEAASKWLWWTTGIVIALVIGFIGYKKIFQRPMQSQASANELIRTGEELVVEGRLPEALEAFKKAHHLAPDDTSFAHYLGPLLIQYEGQTVLGRRLLQQAMSARPDFRPQLLTSMGIADLKDGNLTGAESYFNQALKQNNNYSPAVINLGVLALRKKDYVAARNRFEKALLLPESDQVVALLLAKSLVLLGQTQNKMSSLKAAIEVLLKHKTNHLAYRQEALVLAGYLQSVTDQKAVAENTVSELLDVDPLATGLHTHNIFVVRSPVNWNELLVYCNSLTNSLNPTGRTAVLSGLCNFKADKNQQASLDVQTALQRSPRDPLVQAVSAFVLQGIGQEQSGSVALGKALEFDRSAEYQLPLILQGRFYFQAQDFKSAKEYFKQLLNTNSQSLEAHTGLAQIAFQEGMKEDFKRYIWPAHRVAQDYIPVTSLIAQARKQNWEF